VEGFKQAGRPGQFSPIIPFMVCKSGRHGVAKIFSVAAVELFIEVVSKPWTMG
jgi:hypothetical protein